MATMIYYPPQVNGIQKTLDAQLDTGTTASLTLNNTTNVQNKPGVIVINRIDASGAEKDAADREFVAYTAVSGATLTGLTRNADGGTSDQDHAVNSVVEFIPDVVWAQGLVDWVNVEHNEDGTHDSTIIAELAGTQTFTGDKTFSGAATFSGTTTLPSSGVRNNPRTSTEVSSATPTINTDNVDMHTITALATNITSFTTNLSGTPVNGQKLIIRILDNGTARTITWGASFASRGATLPTTTVLSKYQYNGFIYNSTTSTWDCVATVDEA